MTSDRITIPAGRCLRRGRVRAGFSFLEVLVVIAIIGILLAISIPVVRDMRSLSRRSNCDQNLIRLAMATQAYASDHVYFPSGTLTHSAKVFIGESERDQPMVSDEGLAIASLPEGYHHNWVSALLPYCDREGVFTAIHFEVGVYAPANAIIRESDMPFLRCAAATEVQAANSTSYAGMHSSRSGPITPYGDGLLMLNRQIILDQIPDGSSYTILFGEKLSPPKFDLGWMSGTRSSLRGAGTPINHSVPIENFHDPAFVGGLGSLHAGGASVALADSAVKFLSESIDLEVYRQMVSRGPQRDQEPEAESGE